MNPHPSKNFQTFADNVRKIILRPSTQDKAPFSFVVPLKTILWSVEEKGQGLCKSMKSAIIRTEAWSTIKLPKMNINEKFINSKPTKSTGLPKVSDFLYLPEEPRRSPSVVSNREQLAKVSNTIARNIKREVGKWRLKCKKPKKKGPLTACQLKTSLGNTGPLKRRRPVKLTARIPQPCLRGRQIWTDIPSRVASTVVWKGHRATRCAFSRIPTPQPSFKSEFPSLSCSLQGTIWAMKISLFKIPLKILHGTCSMSHHGQVVPRKRKLPHEWTSRQDISINFIGWGYVPYRRTHLASEANIPLGEGTTGDNTSSGIKADIVTPKTKEVTISEIKGPSDFSIVVQVSQEETTKDGNKIVIGLKKNGEMVAEKDVSIDLGNEDFAEYFSSNSYEPECPNLSKKQLFEKCSSPSIDELDISTFKKHNQKAEQKKHVKEAQTANNTPDPLLSAQDDASSAQRPKESDHAPLTAKDTPETKDHVKAEVPSSSAQMNPSWPEGQVAGKLRQQSREKSQSLPKVPEQTTQPNPNPNKLFHYDDHLKPIDAYGFNLHPVGYKGVSKEKGELQAFQRYVTVSRQSKVSHLKPASESQWKFSKYPTRQSKATCTTPNIGAAQKTSIGLEDSKSVKPPNPPWRSQRYAGLEATISRSSLSKIEDFFKTTQSKKRNDVYFVADKFNGPSRKNTLTRYRYISKSSNDLSAANTLNRLRTQNEASRKSEHFFSPSRTRSISNMKLEGERRRSEITLSAHGRRGLKEDTVGGSKQKVIYQPWLTGTTNVPRKKNDMKDATEATNPRAFFSSSHCGDQNYLFHMKKPSNWKSAHLPNKGLHNHSHCQELPHILQNPTMDCLKESRKVLPRRKGETSSLGSEKGQHSYMRKKGHSREPSNTYMSGNSKPGDQKRPNSHSGRANKGSIVGRSLSKAEGLDSSNVLLKKATKKMSSYLNRIKQGPQKQTPFFPLKKNVPLGEMTSGDRPLNRPTAEKNPNKRVPEATTRSETYLHLPPAESTVSPSSKHTTNKLSFNPSDVTELDIFKLTTEADKKKEGMNFAFNERDGIRNVNSCAQKEVKSTVEATENNNQGPQAKGSATWRASHIERLFREEQPRQNARALKVVEVVPLHNTKSAIVLLKDKEEQTPDTSDIPTKYTQEDPQRPLRTSTRKQIPENTKVPLKVIKKPSSSAATFFNSNKANDRRSLRLQGEKSGKYGAKENKQTSIPLPSGISRVSMRRSVAQKVSHLEGATNQVPELPSYCQISREAFHRERVISERQKMLGTSKPQMGPSQSYLQRTPENKASALNKVAFSPSEKLIKTFLALPKKTWEKTCEIMNATNAQHQKKPVRPVSITCPGKESLTKPQEPSRFDGNAIRNFLENLMKEQELAASHIQALSPTTMIVKPRAEI